MTSTQSTLDSLFNLSLRNSQLNSNSYVVDQQHVHYPMSSNSTSNAATNKPHSPSFNNDSAPPSYYEVLGLSQHATAQPNNLMSRSAEPKVTQRYTQKLKYTFIHKIFTLGFFLFF